MLITHCSAGRMHLLKSMLYTVLHVHKNNIYGICTWRWTHSFTISKYFFNRKKTLLKGMSSQLYTCPELEAPRYKFWPNMTYLILFWIESLVYIHWIILKQNSVKYLNIVRYFTKFTVQSYHVLCKCIQAANKTQVDVLISLTWAVPLNCLSVLTAKLTIVN